MVQRFRYVVALGIALSIVAGAGEAFAQAADQKRTLKAWKAFYVEPGMIEVEVRYMRGTLLMTGDVPSEEHMKKADELADKIKGVKDVRNRLRVREPAVAATTDADLQARIIKNIEEDDELSKSYAKGQLEVAVEKGDVTVDGKVGDYTVATQLIQDIRKIPGVKTIDFKKLKY
jgi:osmotically-inducible protein OsmY